MSSRIFGSGIRRREDPRLITGSATYTGDIVLPRMVHAAMLRSAHAHARITRIDTSQAAAAAGVHAVYTGADIEGALQPVPCAWLLPDSDLKIAAYACIAKDMVRYTGDIVAVIVADTPYLAQDALDLIEVDYEPLPSVTDPEAAAAPDAPQLHAEVEGNQAFHWTVAGGDVDAAFAAAEAGGVVIKERILQQRLIPNAMETRGAVAQYNQATGELTLWNTTQNPHIVRFLCSVVTGVPEDKLRVIAPEVGGGFGSKIAVYPADFVTVFCSQQLGRPVKWIETRSENYQATTHGRDHVQDIELAATKDGRITGLRCTVHAGMGAYLSTAAPGIPTILHGLMLSGCYTIPAIKEDVYGVYTNGVPVEAYRGAGRPEATFMLERLIDMLAGKLGMDPVDVRRKNFIPKFDDGHEVVTTLNYDSGDYPGALDKLLEHTGYSALREKQAAGPVNGKYLGIGPRVLRRDLRPRPVPGRRRDRLPGRAVGERHRPLPPDGQGACLHRRLAARPGRGDHVRADRRQRDRRRHGRREDRPRRHRRDPDGLGHLRQPDHGGRRGGARGGGAQDPRQGEGAGGASARGVGRGHGLRGRQVLRQGIARQGEDHPGHRPDGERRLGSAGRDGGRPRGVDLLRSAEFVFPYGAHLALVEVDAATGQVELTGYTALDDCGPQINPVIVEGQVHGGVVQGIGQALWEGAVYDDSGQLVTGSMLDYALPRADLLPQIDVISTVTRSPHHPLGVKGIGEAGTIASTAAVYNAVMDALKPLGVKRVDMPFTPERVWRAIQDSRGS